MYRIQKRQIFGDIQKLVLYIGINSNTLFPKESVRKVHSHAYLNVHVDCGRT